MRSSWWANRAVVAVSSLWVGLLWAHLVRSLWSLSDSSLWDIQVSSLWVWHWLTPSLGPSQLPREYSALNRGLRTHTNTRDVRIFDSVFVIRHFSGIFCYSALFGIWMRICNRIRIDDGYYKKSKNSNLLLTNHIKRICWWGVLRAIWGHQSWGSHRAQHMSFRVGAQRQWGLKIFFWEGESLLLSSTYYSDSYSQIVDPNYLICDYLADFHYSYIPNQNHYCGCLNAKYPLHLGGVKQWLKDDLLNCQLSFTVERTWPGTSAPAVRRLNHLATAPKMLQ